MRGRNRRSLIPYIRRGLQSTGTLGA
jgi:hypothetical protein